MNLKSLIIGTCLACALTSSCAAQSGDELPRYVLEVQERIRKIGKLQETKKDLLTGTDGGGALSLYSEAGKPRKLVVTVGLSNRDVTHTFYYVDESLVLHIKRDRRFKYIPKRQEFDASGTDRLEENRYYFKKGRLMSSMTIRDVKFSKEEQPTAGPAPNSVEMSNYYLKAARSPGATVDVGDFVIGNPGK